MQTSDSSWIAQLRPMPLLHLMCAQQQVLAQLLMHKGSVQSVQCDRRRFWTCACLIACMAHTNSLISKHPQVAVLVGCCKGPSG